MYFGTGWLTDGHLGGLSLNMDAGWMGWTAQWLLGAIATGTSLLHGASAALQSKCLQQTPPPRSVAMLLVIPTILLAYMAFLKLTSRGPTAGFERLRTKPPGAGKLGGAWTILKPGTTRGGDSVSWLGESELKTLEAICDTLLPGFDVQTRQAEDDMVEQTIAVVRTSLFRGKHSRTSAAGLHHLPPALTAYTRKLAKRCLNMSGRPASDIGVAGLFARACEVNLPHDQRSGLQVLLWVLNTRLGAFLLTGRAVPLPSQSFAARHSLLRRWSRSRIGKFREAFQGMKRLCCSLYFSAHPEAAPPPSEKHETLPLRLSSSNLLDDSSISSAQSTPTAAFSNTPNFTTTHTSSSTTTVKSCTTPATPPPSPPPPTTTTVPLPHSSSLDTAAFKTNPNWRDIRYSPQHLRLAREAGSAGSCPSIPAVKSGLWCGAKTMVAQAARAVRAVSSPTLSTNSNPPSPAHSALTPPVTNSSACGPGFFPRAHSASNIITNSTSRSNKTHRSPCTFQGRAGIGEGGGGGISGGGVHFKEPPGMPKDPCHERTSSTGSNASATATPQIPSEVDVVVVGSGAGGGCAAGALATQGLKVAVLEKGGLYDATDFAGFSEMEAFQSLYEKQGLMSSDDAGVVLMAGSCVGGGTTVNWTASFRTPNHVRVEWARRLGLKSFELGGPFDKALDIVCERLGVNTDLSHRAPFCPPPPSSLRVNQNNCSLWNGATAFGKLPRPVPRNAKGCVDCGSCMHGCAFGSKQSTHTTWLRDGMESGKITLIPNAEVKEVLMDEGRATGVTALVTPPGGGKATSVIMHARAVVVSAGAIHTPAILMRSGLRHPLIGRHLRVHPVLLVGGVFPEDYKEDHRKGNWEAPSVRSGKAEGSALPAKPRVFGQAKARTSVESKAGSRGDGGGDTVMARQPEFGRGVIMGVFVQDWMGLDGGYGAVIETPPIQPGLLGLCVPWNDAISHRLCIGMTRETSTFFCLGRDRSSAENRVVLGPKGNAVVKYTLGKEDGDVLIRVRSEMLRLMRKAGASLLIPAHEGAPWFCPTEGKAGDEDMEEYINAIEEMGTTTNQAGVYSAHQMGSCRLSATPQGGPLRESGETWECNGLFVADASVFPTSLGINPMITIEAVAYMVAGQVATRLGKENWPTGPDTGSEHSPIGRRMKKSISNLIAMAAMPRDAHNPPSPSLNDDEGDTSVGYMSGEEGVRDSNAKAKSPPKGRKVALLDSDDFGVNWRKMAW